MWRSKLLLVLLACAVAAAAAGPVEFGLAELERAAATRGVKLPRIRAEVTADTPESFRIVPNLITGGDLRGLMYGLLEAAEQVRETGRLREAQGAPVTPIRGIRQFLHNADLERDWYYSRDYWSDFFAMLARNRFNRFNLVFAHQTNYLAPPYPYWVDLPEFPQVRVPGLSAAERDRNLETLRYISETAAAYGIDFTLGIWEHNIQSGMKPTVEGLTRDNIGPYSYTALKKVLAQCPAIRSVQMRTNAESGIPNDQQVEFYRDHVFRAIREAGRRVTLDLRAWAVAGGLIDAAKAASVPLRVSTKYWAEDLGRPYQPAETFPGYSFLNFLEKPRAYNFYWEVWGLGSHRLLLWGDPGFVRRAVPTFTLSGSSGFEIDPPLAQKGFGNRPAKWGVFASGNDDRVFWRWEFERYWMFYLLWGRLSYDPKAPERVWTGELERRFGRAAPDVLEAYRAASGVLSEIVAAHLADPNMYIWPEINPGGLLDAYRDVRPSDWRFIASIPEAVRNRLEGVASAKQTPSDTAALLRRSADRIDAAVDRARERLASDHREWRGSEPDFRVLAHLARYHAHKQIAADQAAEFDATGNPDALANARRETAASVATWESLARLTDGLYPADMAFGPDDVGHWRDKLPYVRHDLKLVEERAAVLQRFGAFDFGFDFGGPVKTARGASYRNDPYVLANTVTPRFRAVDPATKFSAESGYGWVTDGERSAHALPLAGYREVRAVAKQPGHLPENVLLGDWISGRGAQTFRLHTGDGEFTASLVRPDGSETTEKLRSRNDFLDVVLPDGEWTVAALIVRRAAPRSAARAPKVAKRLTRPQIVHIPPKNIAAGQPLKLAVNVGGATARTVRLHYRALNQLAKFKTIEQPARNAVFVIPGEELSPRWDLMYYFEVLNGEGTGWFEPDPAVATPYFVVAVEETKTAP